jgi:DNA-binding transcriptional MerR regulator
MTWSTRELAELAGTTVNTIRHYHRLGLLDEPEREYNGYKQYGVPELVRLLRIRRLADLGVPLAQIETFDPKGDTAPDALRALDAELAASIDRLTRARDDIAAILREGSPADGPAGFEGMAARLSQADSSLIHVYGQLYDDDAMDDVRAMVEVDLGAETLNAEIDALPADADEATKIRLAQQLAPSIARHLIDYPWLIDPAGRLPKGAVVTQQTVIEAVAELYNPAQQEVLVRASLLARALIGAEPPNSAPEGVPEGSI